MALLIQYDKLHVILVTSNHCVFLRWQHGCRSVHGQYTVQSDHKGIRMFRCLSVSARLSFNTGTLSLTK